MYTVWYFLAKNCKYINEKEYKKGLKGLLVSTENTRSEMNQILIYYKFAKTIDHSWKQTPMG